MKKVPFLVCYDYGMGGNWAVIYSDREARVTQKYPWLKVFDQRPSWMSNQEYDNILTTQTFDVDDPPTGWLLAASREQGSVP
jgi:phosphoglycerol transferase MdoB-like AlkP superfamily enzyme